MPSAILSILLLTARTTLTSDQQAELRRLLQTPVDWDALQQLAMQHGTLPLLYRHCSAVPDLLPAAALDALQTAYQSNVVQNMLRTGQLLQIVNALQEIGIVAIPFKGPTLAQLAYGDLSLRMFNDLDLLVSTRQLPAVKARLESVGFHTTYTLSPGQEQMFVRLFQHLCMSSAAGELIELHACDKPSRPWFPFRYAELQQCRQAVDVAGAALTTFSSPLLLNYLCVHGAKHYWNCLGWLTDVAELAGRLDGNAWREVLADSRRRGTLTMVYWGLQLAIRLLDARLPEDVRQTVEGHPQATRLTAFSVERFLQGDNADLGAWQTFGLYQRACDRWSDRCRLAIRPVVCPTPADWEFIQLPPHLEPLYFAIRPVRLLSQCFARLVGVRSCSTSAGGH